MPFVTIDSIYYLPLGETDNISVSDVKRHDSERFIVFQLIARFLVILCSEYLSNSKKYDKSRNS